MTKADKYKDNSVIEVRDGGVWAITDYDNPDFIGKIGRIVLAIEHPEQLAGISRVESVMLYNDNDEELYDDQNIVNNDEYHSDDELIDAIAKHYSISRDLIQDV